MGPSRQPDRVNPGSSLGLAPPAVLLLLSMLMVSGYIVLGRAVSADIPTIGLVFWRTLVAVTILGLLFAPRIRRQWPLLWRNWRILLMLGALQAVTGHMLLLSALKSTTALNAGVLMATQPALTVVAAWLLIGETIRSRQFVGLTIAALGALAIVARGDIDVLVGLSFAPGDILVELAMVSFALYNVTIPRLSRDLDPFVTFFGIVAITALVIPPLYAIELLWFDQHMRFDPPTVATVLYFAIFASILGIVFLNTAISKMSPARVGVYLYMLPVFTAFLAILVLGEAPQPYHFFGLAVVTLGVFLASHKGRI